MQRQRRNLLQDGGERFSKVVRECPMGTVISVSGRPGDTKRVFGMTLKLTEPVSLAQSGFLFVNYLEARRAVPANVVAIEEGGRYSELHQFSFCHTPTGCVNLIAVGDDHADEVLKAILNAEQRWTEIQSAFDRDGYLKPGTNIHINGNGNHINLVGGTADQLNDHPAGERGGKRADALSKAVSIVAPLAPLFTVVAEFVKKLRS